MNSYLLLDVLTGEKIGFVIAGSISEAHQIGVERNMIGPDQQARIIKK